MRKGRRKGFTYLAKVHLEKLTQLLDSCHQTILKNQRAPTAGKTEGPIEGLCFLT